MEVVLSFFSVNKVFFTVLLTAFISEIHKILPEPASFPFLDSLTTVMSFVAMFLLAQMRIESWIYWIIIDVIGIVLYFIKDVKFISFLYVLLLILATQGLLVWAKDFKNQKRSVLKL